MLKSLRSGSRHDLDHGSGSKARKKLIEVGDVYRDLSGKSVPSCREDWQKSQIELYRRLIKMLEDI